ncbi:unnamed protein product [Urochloa decumbens]|uniref:Uncharacterized protein n=1 Tax=Urochloa decumbens TaxID=240449 RepID=A0ABC9AJ17_9POAL
MEIVVGALPIVLSKLGGLLISEYNLQKGLKGEIRFLEVELQSMQGALEKVSSTPADELDKQDKIWASAVRELSYDIEDSIDTFMAQEQGREEKVGLHGLKKFIERSLDLLTEFRVRRNIATEIRGIKRRVIEVAEHRVRYKIDNDVAKRVTFDARICTLYKKVTELVGIDEQRDALIKILVEGNQVSKQQDNIVSIVGFGGLGKTTLANVVYEKLRGQFDCSAFVSVSQNPDMEKLLTDMFNQLAKQNKASIDAIRQFLLEKRYIIIIDDIWDIKVWDQIKCALPDNNCGYRIITTTRIFDIAEQVGGAYKMKPLSLHNSKKLLYRRVFSSENKWNNEDKIKCPDEELAEVSDRILKKCAGVPLAIITIASLLASKGRNKLQWYEVCKSIGTGLEDGQDVDNMRKILSFSYYSMPSHLRSCLLYLSVFPEDHYIDKDCLIRMWIAEGFIKCRKQGDSLFEIGESYFNELINRSVIQPVCEEYDGLVDHCRVHDMMLDLICSLSSEEKFVTILNDVHHTSLSKSDRRLSIQSPQVDLATLGFKMSMQQVRSALVFPYNNVILALTSFRHLRVLKMQCSVSPDCSLTVLGYLFLLRYLEITLDGIKAFPEELGNLRFLQILDIQCYTVVVLPSTVFQLRQLKSLSIGDKVKYMLNGIGCLTSLEELSVRVDKRSSENIITEELGLLTELRVLCISFDIDEWTERWENSLVECLGKLKKIRTLSIKSDCDFSLDGWTNPRHLYSFSTDWGLLYKLPAWMDYSSLLVDLSVISIGMVKLQREDLEILGRLPALRILQLKMYNGEDRIGGLFTFRAGSFPCLVHYHYRMWGEEDSHAVVSFQEGAMPVLAVLDISWPLRESREITGAGTDVFDLGLGNLPSLENVTVMVATEGVSKEEVMEARAALVHAAEIHPNRPTLRIYDDLVPVGGRGFRPMRLTYPAKTK